MSSSWSRASGEIGRGSSGTSPSLSKVRQVRPPKAAIYWSYPIGSKTISLSKDSAFLSTPAIPRRLSSTLYSISTPYFLPFLKCLSIYSPHMADAQNYILYPASPKQFELIFTEGFPLDFKHRLRLISGQIPQSRCPSPGQYCYLHIHQAQ